MADRLTPEQIYSLTNTYGFADPVMATAIVLGESGGDYKVISRKNSDGSVDRGLWQINNLAHPSVSDSDALSIDKSTRYALELSKGGTDWSHWNARLAPTFPTHLATARAAINDDELLARDASDARQSGADQVRDIAGKAADAVGAVVSPFASLADAAGKVLSVITSGDFWRRAGLVVLGAAVIIVGAVLLFGRDVAGTAIAAKTGGAVQLPDEAE